MDDYKEAHDVPELCELLGIKTHVREPQYFASLDVRLLAIIIDYFNAATIAQFVYQRDQLRIKIDKAAIGQGGYC